MATTSDKLDSSDIVANDTILPEQCFAPRLQTTPEKRLIAAVLEDALQVYGKHRTYGDSLQGRFYTLWRNAYVWLTDLEEDRIFSMVWCCEALGIEAAALAKKIVAREPIAIFSHNRPVNRQQQITAPLPRRVTRRRPSRCPRAIDRP